MLQDSRQLYGKKLAATDGPIGHVKDFYFDDVLWVIRYIVVDTGSWLSGRLVLLTPHAFGRLDQSEDELLVSLTKKQIQEAPSVSAHETVTRQFEEQYYRSYGWPVYWQGGRMWGDSGTPPVASPLSENIEVRKALEPPEDRHLESTKVVTGYRFEATDGAIGRVAGFRVDPDSWAIRDLVVELTHWPMGKPILVSTVAIKGIEFKDKKVLAKLTKAQIQGS
jgi:hypothetical protein